jgi:coenzyme F420-reducing hydrogenase beta subunit
MYADGEGFEYPQIDTERCTQCRRCEKVCPALNQVKNQNAPAVYACYNRNAEIRKQSSSGGIFTLLAEQVFRQNGIVFGACFNERWEVVHCAAESADQLEKLRGSKYVQSRLGDIFGQIKQSLKTGRKVLFSGTPCQVAGLKKGLNKKDPNLLMIDIVCHGVPSPLVFHLYRQEIEQRYHSPIRHFSFRNKTHGWKNFHVNIEFETDTLRIFF